MPGQHSIPMENIEDMIGPLAERALQAVSELEDISAKRKREFEEFKAQLREAESRLAEIEEDARRTQRERLEFLVRAQKKFDERVDYYARKRALKLQKKGKRRNGKRTRT